MGPHSSLTPPASRPSVWLFPGLPSFFQWSEFSQPPLPHLTVSHSSKDALLLVLVLLVAIAVAVVVAVAVALALAVAAAVLPLFR